MRLHISLDDELVQHLDSKVGARDRSKFIAQAVRQALEESDRREALERAIGSVADSGHEWDENPAEWVRAQRANRPLAC